jgi:hypothetical protein
MDTQQTSQQTSLTNSAKVFSYKTTGLFISVLIILLASIFFYFGRKNNSQNVFQSTAQPTPIVTNPSTETSLPLIAYIYTFGIALENNNNPDLGGIFLVHLDGTQKRKLSTIDKKDLHDVSARLVFSPLSKELLVNTYRGLVGVNINTGQQRKISEDPVFSYEISEDYKFVCYVDKNGVKQLKLVEDTTKTTSSSNCHDLKQPNYDSKTNISIKPAAKQILTGGAGDHILSSRVTVQNGSNKKVFDYNKPGSIVPVFIANNYLYFTVEQCCVGNNSLLSLQQMNLDTGKVSDPTSLMPIFEKIQAFSNRPKDESRSGGWVGDLGISPDGNHYLYLVSTPKDKDYVTQIYDYTIASRKEVRLSEFVGNITTDYPTWSSNSRYVLLNGIFYDEKTGTITKVHLPEQFYTILQ